jgi:hypothetical protein
MSNGLPRFELARVYSDGKVEPLVYPIGSVPLDTIANRRGFMGAGALTAGVLVSAMSTPASAQTTTAASEIEGSERCASIESSHDRNRAHSAAIVEILADEPAGAVITRDYSKIRIWTASRLAREHLVDLGSKEYNLLACGYFLKRSGTDNVAGKIVLLNKTEASEYDLSTRTFSTLVSNGEQLLKLSAASAIHFINNRTILAVVRRTLHYFDLTENRIRLSVDIPGTDQQPTVALSRDRQWLAVMDSDGIQLWSVYRGTRVWNYRHPVAATAPAQFSPASPPSSDSAPDPLPQAIGFMSNDRHIICAAAKRYISIHDRKNGDLVVRRTFENRKQPSVEIPGRSVDEVDDRSSDGLQVIWEAGFDPSLWSLRKLSRRCTFAIELRSRRALQTRFAMMPGTKRGFAVNSSSHVVALDLEQGTFIGYLKDPDLAAPPPPSPPSTYYPGSSYSPGGMICTCNKVCTCIPVRRCQAHELLHDDPIVRIMSEELLLSMGVDAFTYMTWAAEVADARLAARIHDLMSNIARGRRTDSMRWPTAGMCFARLDASPVIATMSAQWLCMLCARLPGAVADRATSLLHEAPNRSWQILASEGYRTRRRRNRHSN